MKALNKVLRIERPEYSVAAPGTAEFDQAMYTARKRGLFKQNDDRDIVEVCKSAQRRMTRNFKRKR